MSRDTVLRSHGLIVERRSRRNRFRLEVGDLSLRAGEVLAILGVNGAGKTSLLRALAGLDPPGGGSVEAAAPGAITMVFQRPIAFDGSVAHNVRVALRGTALSRGEREQRVRGALEQLGIADLARRGAARLSGGELRRLALARAFVRRPQVLLLDEPFDDLDAQAQAALHADLRAAIGATGVAVVIVTHDLRHAVSLAKRLAVLDAGRLRQIGACAEVLAHPETPTIARLVGMANLIPGTLRAVGPDGRGRVEVSAGHVVEARTTLPVGQPVWLGIRGENLKLDVGRGERTPIGKARVVEIRSDGVVTTVALEWARHTLWAHLLSGRGLSRTLGIGDSVTVCVEPEDVHLLEREAPGSSPARERTGAPSRPA